jgi:hypothetical protein
MMSSAPVSLRRDYRSALCLSAAAVFALSGLLPGPLRWFAGALALVAPGWSALRSFVPADTERDPAAIFLLAVGLSIVADISVVLALSAAGASFSTTNIGVILALFEVVCAVGCLRRSARNVTLADSRERRPGRAGRHLGPAPRPFMIAAGALGVVVIVTAIAAIRAFAPGQANPPYAWIAYTNASATNQVNPVEPGPFTVSIEVHAHGPAPGNLSVAVTLDGRPVAAPVPVKVSTGGTVRLPLTAVLPPLDGCVHRIDITLNGGPGQPARGLTTYVTGAGQRTCTDAAP